MPFTPFHFGPGAVLHAVAPGYVSFLAFCGANVLVDVEPLYFMLKGEDPLHRFFHTYVGVSLVVAATVAVFLFARRMSRVVPLPDLFQWKQLSVRAVFIGAALGGYTHIVLDSIMHADIRPLAPFSEANGLYLWVDLGDLHWYCFVAGVVALLVLGLRRGFSAL